MSGDHGNAFVGIPVVDCRIQAHHSCVLDFLGHFLLGLVVFDSNVRLDCAGRDPSLPYCVLWSCGVHFVGQTALAAIVGIDGSRKLLQQRHEPVKRQAMA